MEPSHTNALASLLEHAVKAKDNDMSIDFVYLNQVLGTLGSLSSVHSNFMDPPSDAEVQVGKYQPSSGRSERQMKIGNKVYHKRSSVH